MHGWASRRSQLPGDWVIIHKQNKEPKTMDIIRSLPKNPVYENKLFREKDQQLIERRPRMDMVRSVYRLVVVHDQTRMAESRARLKRYVVFHSTEM